MTDSVSSSSSSVKPHRGVLILVLGILGLVACMPLGIVAWVMGSGDLKAIDRGEIDPTGRSMTNAGKILGIIAVVLAVLGILFFVVGVMILGIGGGMLAGAGN